MSAAQQNKQKELVSMLRLNYVQRLYIQLKTLTNNIFVKTYYQLKGLTCFLFDAMVSKVKVEIKFCELWDKTKMSLITHM